MTKPRRTKAESIPAPLLSIGWRERVALPQLGIAAIKAKVDTGARSSALHAFDLKSFERNGQTMIRFAVHPIQHSKAGLITVETQLFDERSVRSSNGKAELRPVIRTNLMLGSCCWPIEMTLTNRDSMGFRMLLGRQALRKRCLIDAGRSYLQGYPQLPPSR
jgi:hypothetical protein